MTHTAKHTPGPIDIPTPCSVCGTRGWILARNDTHGLRVERCDECTIMNDNQAWDMAEPFLVDLLMRFDEGTNLEKAAAAPAMYEALKAILDSENSTLGDGGSILGDDYRSLLQAALAQAEGAHT